MLEAWLAGAMLVLESNSVIHLRPLKLAAGGHASQSEAALMVNEKVSAVLEAQTSMMSGGRRFPSLKDIVSTWRQTQLDSPGCLADGSCLSAASAAHPSIAKTERVTIAVDCIDRALLDTEKTHQGQKKFQISTS
jgi:hypothetical protein